MSKLCVKCGAALEDTAMFCNVCGTQQPAPQQPVYQQPVYQQPVYQQPAPQQPKPKMPIQLDEKKKKILIGAGAVVGVILIILLAVLIFQPAGKGAVDTMYDVMYEGEVDKCEDLLPEQMWEYLEDNNVSQGDFEDGAEKVSKSITKSAKKQFGSDYDIKYEIIETKDLEDSDVRKLASAMSKLYGNRKYLKKDDVQDIKEIWVKTTIEGSKGKDISISNMAIIKVDGKWYVGEIYKDSGKYKAAYFAAMEYAN